MERNLGMLITRVISTLIPAQPISTNRQTDTFSWRENQEGPKPALKIPKSKSTPPEIVDLVVFDPCFSLGKLTRANYATEKLKQYLIR